MPKQSPYTRRFLEVFEYLLKEGDFDNQTEFCKLMEFHTNTIAAFKRGDRNVTIEQVHKLHHLFHVPLYYIFTGKGDMRNPPKKEPTPEQKTELEKRLAVAEALTQLQQRVIEEKNKEISYLRELLKKQVEGDS